MLLSPQGRASTPIDVANEVLSRSPIQSAVASDSTADLPGKTFTDGVALDEMSAAAAQRIAETIGSFHQSDQHVFEPVRLNEKVIGLPDLTLTEFRFVPATRRIDTSAATFTEFREPEDVWVAVWTRDRVPAPDWGGIETTVRVVVVMKDGSGHISSMHVQRVNPNAEALPPELSKPLR
jgi:hypothetical protein